VASRSFLSTQAQDGGLFQSDEWARLQAAAGHEAYPFQGVGFEGHAFIHTLPLIGRYLFLPRGPVVNTTIFASEEFRRQLLEFAEATRSSWIRVEPQTDETLAILKTMFGSDHVVAAPRDTNPRETLMVTLDDELEQRLERMKSKTRYNVRLAEKHGVTVRFSRSVEDVETFLSLITSTTNRKAIAPHPKSYYRDFIQVLPEEMCVIALAEHDGQVIAASLLAFFEGTAYYLHGGSGDRKRDLMAPFLLQFRSMEEAKRRGCLVYDFGGVSTQPTTDNRQPATADWSGITRFKQGFAPDIEPLLFPGTHDIILSSSRYALYLASRRLMGVRRMARNIISHISL
jgi:lipid II:glycine glycyltransferase (peptidoglycan interpeptide bridge formation enzyme)